MRHTVTGQAQLVDCAVSQQAWIRRSVRSVTGTAAFSLDRRMFVSERTLLVCVALDAGGIRSGRQSGLLRLKAAVRIVTIAATHRAFQDFVMERR